MAYPVAEPPNPRLLDGPVGLRAGQQQRSEPSQRRLMADQDDRPGMVRPVRGAEQVGDTGADAKLLLDLHGQAENFGGLQGPFGGTRQYGNLGQPLGAQPLGHLLCVAQPARAEFPVGIGDRAVGLLRLGMTPQYQIQNVLRMIEAAGLPAERDSATTAPDEPRPRCQGARPSFRECRRRPATASAAGPATRWRPNAGCCTGPQRGGQ
jgi:hypothetical protein